MGRQHAEAVMFHYFWGSQFFTPIYGVLLLAVVTREPFVLFGIPLVVLWFMLDRAVAWVTYATDGRDLKDVLAFLRWWTRLALKRLGDAADGDALTGFLAMKTLNFWTKGTGKDIALSVTRALSRDSRERILKETEDVLVENMKVFNIHSSRFCDS